MTYENPTSRKQSDTKNMTNDFPPNLQLFVQLLDAQPPVVQEAFQFLLATAMHHEAGKLEPVSVTEVDGRWHYTFSGAGEVFSVVGPEMSKEMLREILREEGLLCVSERSPC